MYCMLRYYMYFLNGWEKKCKKWTPRQRQRNWRDNRGGWKVIRPTWAYRGGCWPGCGGGSPRPRTRPGSPGAGGLPHHQEPRQPMGRKSKYFMTDFFFEAGCLIHWKHGRPILNSSPHATVENHSHRLETSPNLYLHNLGTRVRCGASYNVRTNRIQPWGKRPG